MAQEVRHFSGTVTSVNQYGITIDGHEGYINFGKFYSGTKDLNRGDQVEIDANPFGDNPVKFYIKTLTFKSRATQVQQPQPGGYSPPSAVVDHSSKDRAIARAVALKAAVDVLREDTSDGDEICKLAGVFERWLQRPEEPKGEGSKLDEVPFDADEIPFG